MSIINSFEDLRKLRKEDPEKFKEYLKKTENGARFLRLVFGIHPGDSDDSAFESREEFVRRFFINPYWGCSLEKADRYAKWFGRYVDEALAFEQDMLSDLVSLSYDNLDLDRRIALEKIRRSETFKRYVFGELTGYQTVAKEGLIRFLRDFKAQREDIYASNVIKPEEFDAVVKRYGEAAILNSLEQGSERHIQILDKEIALHDFLMSLSLEERLNPLEIRKNNPEMHKLALGLYGRFECAVKDLCGHTFTLRGDILNVFYREFVDNLGDDAVRERLLRHKFGEKRTEKIISLFNRSYDQFTGASRDVSSSELERQIEGEMEGKVFYRRQVAYKELYETDRNFILDFMIYTPDGRVVIEVEDDFNDREKIEEKKAIVESAGDIFILVTKKEQRYDKIKYYMGQAIIPNEVYKLRGHTAEEIRIRFVEKKRSRTERRSAGFLDNDKNRFMKGYILQNV